MNEILAHPFLIFALGSLIIPCVRFGYRWAIAKGRNQVVAEINAKFVYDVATNHLPHVYDALRLIAANQGVELPEPPPIRFLPDKK